MANVLLFRRERLIQCCRELCARCEMGHVPSLDEDLELNHGTDQIYDQPNSGEPSYIAPEKCDAAPIWRMIREAET